MGEGRRTGVTGRLLHHHTEGGERGNDLGAARAGDVARGLCLCFSSAKSDHDEPFLRHQGADSWYSDNSIGDLAYRGKRKKKK